MLTDTETGTDPGGAAQKLQRLFKSPVTLTITVVNIVVFSVAEYFGNTSEVATLLQFGASERSRIWDSGEYWRFVTPMFLHIGLLHLVWNTWAGFFWSSRVEKALGWQRFLFAYLCTGVAASAVSVIGHNVVSAGASGAGAGIVGVNLVLMYRVLGSVDAFFKDAQARSDLTSIGLWLLMGFTVVSMDNHAHIGGLVTGVALGLMLTTPGIDHRRARWRMGAALASLAMLVFLASQPLPVLHATERAKKAAFAALQTGNYNEALALTEDINNSASQRDNVLHIRAFAHFYLGKPDQALADIDRVLEFDPNYMDGYRLRGEVRVAQNDFRGAVDDFTLALKASPRSAELFYGRAHAYERLEEIEKALADLDEAIKLQPAFEDAYATRGVVRYRAGDFEGALADLDRAAKIFPDRPLILVNRAILLSDMNNLADAERDVLVALKRDAKIANGQSVLCALRVRQEKFSEAEAACTGAIEQTPDDFAALVNRGYAYLETTKLELAVSDFEAALKVREDFSIFLGRGTVKLKQGDVDGALADANRTLLLSQDNADAYFLRGNVWAAKGRKGAALADYRQALAKASEDWSRKVAVEEEVAKLTGSRSSRR